MSSPGSQPYLDAVKLVGLLADDDRRRVVAALVLGAADSASVVAATDLSVASVGRALARLEDAGLVERGTETGQRLDRLDVDGAEDQCRHHPPPLLVGQQADQLRGVQRWRWR